MRGLFVRTLPVMDHLVVRASVRLADGLVDVADRTSVRMSREAGLMTQGSSILRRNRMLMIICFVRFAGHFRNAGSARPNGRRPLLAGPSGALRASGQNK